MIREGLPQSGHLSQGQEKVREQTMHTARGEVFQAEGAASAMALRLNGARRDVAGAE